MPALGRIAHLARRDCGAGGGAAPAANALWFFADAPAFPVEGWVNAGGEKLWFWPQSDWMRRMARGWPPPEVAATETRAEPWGLSWLLPAYAQFGLTLRRELRFAADDPAGFRLVTRVVGEPVAGVSPWSVIQILKPSGPLRIGAAAGAAWRAMSAAPGTPEPEPLAAGGWELRCSEWPAFKHGFAADMLSAPTPAGRLSITAESGPAAWPAESADAAVRAQVFSAAPDGLSLPPGTLPYVELEFVAPPSAREWTLHWRLE